MSNKGKRQSISRKNRRILVVAVAVFLVLISVLAYMSTLHYFGNGNNDNTATPDANKYFAISNLGGIYEVHTTSNMTPGSMVLLKQLAFSFTPVGGDAPDVRITLQGIADPAKTDWEGQTFVNGTSVNTGDILLRNSIPLYKDPDTGTYPLDVTFHWKFHSKDVAGNVELNFTAAELVPIYSPV
jgi:hypothetical protein